jgi:hypothetical protein
MGPALSAQRAKAIAHERYGQFDSHRCQVEALEADEEDLKDLEALEEQIKRNRDK